MGKYEVTQAEWLAVTGNNPSDFDGRRDNNAKGMNTSRFPVENVRLDMICGKDGFLEKINAHGGIREALGATGTFRLPNEDEWEYACRGGSGNAHAFHFGDKLSSNEANCANVPYGTAVKGDHFRRPCAVDDTNQGKYPRHPWGLMHMHGNVWEWCDNSPNKLYAGSLRGGSWNANAYFCRAACRYIGRAPVDLGNFIGFRVVISGPP